METKTYYVQNTPYQTWRLYVSNQDGLLYKQENLLWALNTLSCWGGIDQKAENNAWWSWEFDLSLYETIQRLMFRVDYKQTENWNMKCFFKIRRNAMANEPGTAGQ